MTFEFISVVYSVRTERSFKYIFKLSFAFRNAIAYITTTIHNKHSLKIFCCLRNSMHAYMLIYWERCIYQYWEKSMWIFIKNVHLKKRWISFLLFALCGTLIPKRNRDLCIEWRTTSDQIPTSYNYRKKVF